MYVRVCLTYSSATGEGMKTSGDGRRSTKMEKNYTAPFHVIATRFIQNSMVYYFQSGSRQQAQVTWKVSNLPFEILLNLIFRQGTWTGSLPIKPRGKIG